jgi:hypothetical protein
MSQTSRKLVECHLAHYGNYHYAENQLPVPLALEPVLIIKANVFILTDEGDSQG